MVSTIGSLRHFLLLLLLGGVLSQAQASKTTPTRNPSSAEQGVHLAEIGRCVEALPVLGKASAEPLTKEMKRRVSLATIRCAMTLDKRGLVLDSLKSLNRDFPDDPEVLYISTHAYSDLATRASVDLARTAPDSSQAHEIRAEALETQGKWDDAAKEYRLILQHYPELRGIHFRLGRLLLSQPNPPADMAQQAQKEFEAELKIDPSNAGAEYVLGEMARQGGQWDEAIQHFSRATELDAGFGDAFLGLGNSLLSAKRFADAVAPLQTAVKLESRNPGAHYSLATALTRAGRKEEAEREFAIHRQMTQKGEAEQGEQAGTQQNPN
jgi:tetratricopeptide (TPR) repeat protein